MSSFLLSGSLGDALVEFLNLLQVTQIDEEIVLELFCFAALAFADANSLSGPRTSILFDARAVPCPRVYNLTEGRRKLKLTKQKINLLYLFLGELMRPAFSLWITAGNFFSKLNC